MRYANDSIIPNSGFRCLKYRYCEINRIVGLVEVDTMTNTFKPLIYKFDIPSLCIIGNSPSFSFSFSFSPFFSPIRWP
jgi:hypothetical protein